MSISHNNEFANNYFLKRMENIFVDRGVYKVVENFLDYLKHRYRNNCYNYSATAIMGMRENDYLVRGTLTLSHDWMWCNGGYAHGWVEFLYDGQEFVFDSRCKEIVQKKEWYDEFNPKEIVRFSKQEVIDTIFVPEKITAISNGVYQVDDSYEEQDTNNLINPFRKAKIHFDETTIKKFIAYKEFCN